MMATNPELPDYPNIPPRKPEHERGKVQLIRQGKFPWPIAALIVAAVLLIVIIAVLPKLPHLTPGPTGAQVPQQPTADQVQFTNLKISPAPAGGAIYLTGLLHNIGNSDINGAQVEAEFLDRNGPILATLSSKVEGVSGGTVSQDLTEAPIKPNEARPVRIYFEHTPKGWNHQLPELNVTTVTGTTP